MPRLRPQLFHRARSINGLLPLVLRATRDLGAARNELRWLTDFAIEKAKQTSTTCSHFGWRHILQDLCEQRSRGRPLQYILGTEFFGDLEITCRPGVLIPRQETAASVIHLVQRLVNPPQQLRVLDLCTGTGCIPLLFQHEFYRLHHARSHSQVLGVDLSPKAIRLSEDNLARHKREGRHFDSVHFARADVMASDAKGQHHALTLRQGLSMLVGNTQPSAWDVLISNPPYISPQAFNSTTARSVRSFEPKLALVPELQHTISGVDPGDVFYPRLLDHAEMVDAKIVLFEVADMEQAQRVATMFQDRSCWKRVEIWRDDPSCQEGFGSESSCESTDDKINIVGHGNGRSVFAWRQEASIWLGT